VYLLNAVDGCLPSDLATGTPEEIEEERRLLYVAMTRAKEQLDIIVPQRFYTQFQEKGGDRHLYAARTRFLPDRILSVFEQRFWNGNAVGKIQPLEGRVQVDIPARARSRWR
jgi:DNA helicase-2/ATP-dependent DNA helicase PcrA